MMTQKYEDEAINLAMQRQWEEAVTINEKMIELFPNDIGAHNRLGKALTELGRYVRARKTYEFVLELDPGNSIARRNVNRLLYLKDDQWSPKTSYGINSGFFIEEASKARMVNIHAIAPRERLAKLSAGDIISLQAHGQTLAALNDSGEYLGAIEPKVGLRLAELMKGGNQYTAAIIRLREDSIKVIVKEVFQHPTQIGHLSFFPPRPAEEMKPYLKSMIVKYDLDDESPEEREGIGDWENELEPNWQNEPPPEEGASVLVTEDG